MVVFYVRMISVKKTMTLDKVPPLWHDDVQAELIRIGFMTAPVETPVETPVVS